MSFIRLKSSLFFIMFIAAVNVMAGPKFEFDEDKDLSLGLGIRAAYNSVEDGAANGKSRSSDFSLSSMRLYLNANKGEHFSLEFNTECETDRSNNCNDIRILDAVLKYKYNDLFQVWAGRFLPPSDRSNLSGPYYLNAWTFPVAQAYPAIFAGRDDGVAIWGQTGGGKFKYQLGIFDGNENSAGNNLNAIRLTYNFLDPEPGYYNSSTYYGDKDILALGFSYQSQSDGVDIGFDQGDFKGMSLDLLFEKKLGSGVLGFEASYYDYDYDGIKRDTDGGFTLLSYLFNESLGMGRVQLMLRRQWLELDGFSETRTNEVGVSYIVSGHNLRFSLLFENRDESLQLGSAQDRNAFVMGVQFQL